MDANEQARFLGALRTAKDMSSLNIMLGEEADRYRKKDADQRGLIDKLREELKTIQDQAQTRGVGDGNLIGDLRGMIADLREELDEANGMIAKYKDELKHETNALIMMTHSRDAFRYAAAAAQRDLNGAREASVNLAQLYDGARKECDAWVAKAAAAVDLAKEPKGPIPPRVYWDAEGGNFYSMTDCCGMGNEFFKHWFPARNEFPQRSVNTLSPDDLRAAPQVPHIRLTLHEIQSNHNRVRYAEGLIRQLPETHDGRNSWLLNYGVSDEAMMIRYNRGIDWDDRTKAAYPAGTPAKASTPAGGALYVQQSGRGLRPVTLDSMSKVRDFAPRSGHAPIDKTDEWDFRSKGEGHDVRMKRELASGAELPADASPHAEAIAKRISKLGRLEHAARAWHDMQSAPATHELYSAVGDYFGIKSVIPD